MKRRKLLSRAAIEQLKERLDMGVPLATAIAKLELNLSRPSAKHLIEYYSTNKFEQSLFPPWLEESPAVQEQPDNWRYVGYFPLGEWYKCNDL